MLQKEQTASALAHLQKALSSLQMSTELSVNDE